MSTSILTTVKKLLLVDEGDEDFNLDILVAINTSISILHQLGLGPDEGLLVLDDTATWTDLVGEAPHLSMVQTYVGLKSRMFFDPPTGSVLKEAIASQIAELEWRINIEVDTIDRDVDDSTTTPEWVTQQIQAALATLHPVATTGDFGDLENVPNLFDEVYVGPDEPSTGDIWIKTGDDPVIPVNPDLDGGVANTTSFDGDVDGGLSTTTVFTTVVSGGVA